MSSFENIRFSTDIILVYLLLFYTVYKKFELVYNTFSDNFGVLKMKGLKFEKISEEQLKIDAPTLCLDDIVLPCRATCNSAGYDFFAPFSFELAPSQTLLVQTGIKAKMNKDVALFIFPRSGLGFKYRLRLCNTVGIIDADYYDNPKNEGHIMIKLSCEGDVPVKVEKGSAFAQGVFLPYFTTEDDVQTALREGGFGSTDKKLN